MVDRKKERDPYDVPDTRDIFEKALDYGVPVAAGYLGGKAGARINSGGNKALKRIRNERAAAIRARDTATKPDDAVWHDRESRYLLDDEMNHYNDRFVGGLMGGGVAGPTAAYWNFLNNPSTGGAKRRADWERSRKMKK